MKISLPLFFFISFLSFNNAVSQQQWAWMNGSNTWNGGTNIVRGPLGSFSPITRPHCRSGAATWKDAQGYFWMYGGFGQGKSDELFKFDPHRNSPTFNQWMWVKGDTAGLGNNLNLNRVPVRNTITVPNISSTPGYRKDYPCSWTDQNGKFWLFGGDSMTFNPYGDMWMYDPATNIWTWMNGSSKTSQTGVCGPLGVYGANYTPGARSGASSWTDNNGLLWLFGGKGMDCTTPNISLTLNDLWVFDPNPGSPNYNKWAMIRDNSGPLFARWGIYGTKGVANPVNTPGARSSYTSWTDASGDLWLWGGEGAGPASQSNCMQFLNDLWKYNIASNTWTWVSGDSVQNNNGSFGAQCTPSASNVPPQLREVSAHWVDECNNLWLFGGYRTSSGGGNCPISSVLYNTLWKYDIATNEWTWISGTNTNAGQATYGNLGQASPNNVPSARMGMAAWRDEEGLWLYGGYGILPNFSAGYVADMWLFSDKPNASFIANPNNACSNANVVFSNTSTPNCNDPLLEYQWNFGDPASGVTNTASSWNANHFYSAVGNYTTTLIISNCLLGKDTAYQNLTVNEPPIINPVIQQPACAQNNGIISLNVISNAGPFSYSWSNASNSSSISNLASGVYQTTVTDINNCSTTSIITLTNSAGPTLGLPIINHATCNGSANGLIQPNISNGNNPFSFVWSNTATTATISNLAAGSYTVVITDANQCTSEGIYLVSEPSAFNVNTNSTIENCSQLDGSAIVTNVTGNTSPYTYFWSNGATNNSITGIPSGIFTVTISDTNFCSTIATVTVGASIPILANTNFQDASCGLPNGWINSNPTGGDGNYSYLWNINTSNSSISNLSAGLYTVTVTDGFGCSTNQTVNILNVQSLNIDTLYFQKVNCFNGNDGLIATDVNGGTTPYTYTWSNMSNAASISNLAAGVYSVSVSDANNCVGLATFTVTEPPLLLINPIPSTTICSGQSISLSASATGGTASYSYNWIPGNITGSSISVNPQTPTSYSVVVTDNNNCTSIQTVNIEVYSLPIISFSASATEGCEPLCIIFNNLTPSTTSAFWNFGNGVSSINSNPDNCFNSGIYSISLTVIDANGCSNTSSNTNYITVHPNPIASFNSSTNLTTLSNSTIEFTNSSTDAIYWQWTFGDISSSSSSDQNTAFTYNDTGYFSIQLIAENQFGCTDTAYDQVYIGIDKTIYTPNTFTPNEDGVNDVFIPKISIEMKSYELSIFDRWGGLIFQSNSPAIGWNGRANNGNAVAQQDSYIWMVKAKDNKGKLYSFCGHLNLVK